jgi:hypothetical protein
MTSNSQYIYKIGDRVAERPKQRAMFGVKKETKDWIKKNIFQRYGTVIGMVNKPNKNGRKQKYLIIQWDHLKTPMQHAQMRICPADAIEQLTATGYGCSVE